MTKYHINKNGVPSECFAKIGNCPFASADEHLDDFESAQYMSDFKMQVESDLYKAMEYHPYEYLSNKELRIYRKIVLDELNKEHSSIEKNQIPIKDALSKEQLQDLYNKARNEILLENKDYIDSINHARATFDFRHWKNNVPKGLIENVTNNKIAKLFCDEYFLDENNQIDVKNRANLHDRFYNKVLTSRYAQNFKEAVAIYKREIDKNVEKYKLATMTNEEIDTYLASQTNARFENLKQTAKPTVQLRRTNNAEIKDSNRARKEILAKLNREMSIRNNFSKYIQTEPKFIKRINSTDLPSTGDYDLKINPMMKNNEIDNVYLMADDNKLYKVVGFSSGEKVDVIDYAGFRKSLSTRNTVKRADLHTNYTFLEIETNDETLEPWRGLKTIHFEDNNN